MPYQNEKPSQSDVSYFLKRYEGFKKQAEELIQKYSKEGFNYKWVIEHSSFSDPGPDYNRLILICSSDKLGEEKRISCFEKGY
jgi:hypothetical protein